MSERRREERERLLHALGSTPAELAAAARADTRPRAEGEWTAHQNVLHLVAVEELVWHSRLEQLEAESHPQWFWVEPGTWDGEAGATLDGALREFARRRGATIAMLEALDDDGWARVGTHRTYGALDVAGLMKVAVDHDREHLASLLSSST